MTADLESTDGYQYQSDLKKDKHLFNVSNNSVFGSMIASVLNLYGCLPVYVDNGYNLLQDNTAVNDVKNIVFKNAYLVSTNSINKIAYFYNNKKNEYSSEAVPDITVSGSLSDKSIVSLIDKNLNYRFPVVIFNDNSSYIISGKRSDGKYTVNGTENTVVSENYNVIDTYSYLMKIAVQENIEDKYNYTEQFYDTIEFSVPTSYTNNDVKFFNCNNTELTIVPNVANGAVTLSSISDGDEYIAGIKTSYTGIIPNVYNSSKYYKVIQYAGENEYQWYYRYLFKATNTDIIKGISQDGSIQFMPAKKLSRAELITMIMRAVDADVSEYNMLSSENAEKLYNSIITAVHSGVSADNLSELGLPDTNAKEKSEHISLLRNYLSNDSFSWAKEYMNFAYAKGLINEYQYLGLDYFTNYDVIAKEDSETDKQIAANAGGCNIKVRRDDAAYIICDMLVRNILEVTVPINVYKYSKEVSCERNTYWNTDTAFVDVTRSYPYCTEEIYQMYMNGLMEGDTERRFNPDKILTRAEVCAVIVRSLFSLDEGLENVKVVEMGEANYISFGSSETQIITQASDRNGSGEFYFVAPKTGYYYISDVNGCSVTVNDMRKREIKGLEAYDSSTQITNGARYNIRMGETAYINVKPTGNEYSFKITQPQEGELVFAPDRTGTFIYDNCPEYILCEDLADEDCGNTCLITADGVTGNVSMVSSHLIRRLDATLSNSTYTHDENNCDDLAIYHDYILYNPTDSIVKVTIKNVGVQITNPTDDDYYVKDNGEIQLNLTKSSSASFQAWADYKNTSLINSNQFIENKSHDGTQRYFDYINGTGSASQLANKIKNDTIVVSVKPHSSEWLLNEYATRMELSKYYGYTYFSAVNCEIEGTVNISSVFYHKKEKVRTPNQGKLYTSKSRRDYFNEEDSEINQIGEKYKGVANASNEVYSESDWDITEANSFFTPIMYNPSSSFGFIPYTDDQNNIKIVSRVDGKQRQINKANYWMTHKNSESTKNSRRVVNSDMLSFKFTGKRVGENIENDVTDNFYFDNYHTNTEEGNEIIKNNENKNAIDMANFSITEYNSIKIYNNTNDIRHICYAVSAANGLYFTYEVTYINNDGTPNEDMNQIYGKKGENIKCETLDTYLLFYELFDFEMPVGATAILTYSIAVPNVAMAGNTNMLYAE